jgi:hypothetical protein
MDRYIMRCSIKLTKIMDICLLYKNKILSVHLPEIMFRHKEGFLFCIFALTFAKTRYSNVHSALFFA